MCRSSAYRAAQRGEIPTITLNGRLHVPTARLRALLGDLDAVDMNVAEERRLNEDGARRAS